MKRIYTIITLLSASLLLSNCQRENTSEGVMNEMVKITVETADDTRTYINESAHRVEWSNNDRIVVFENNKFANSLSTSITNGKAAFNVVFNSDVTSPSFTYNAIYPTSCFAGGNSIDLTKVELTLPSTQSATSTSFDPAADMLIAKPQTMKKQAESITMQFKRIVAMAKLTISNLPTSVKISEVKFTAQGKQLAGKSFVNLNTSEVSMSNNTSDNITVKYNNSLSMNKPAVYFNCYPTTLSAGDTFSVTITSDEGVSYTKEVTIPAGRSLTFEQGNLATFNIDMKGITGEEPKQEYKIGDIVTVSGCKGIVFDIKTDNYGTWCYIFSMDETDLQWSTVNADCGYNHNNNGQWMTQDLFNPRYGNQDINNYPAFKWCIEHGDGWFLPSSKELTTIWTWLSDGTYDFNSESVTTLNKYIADNGGTPFNETYYWSSNENSTDTGEVVAFMKDSYVCLNLAKSNYFSVRAAYRILLEE